MSFENTIESTNILNKISSKFYTELYSEKWQERKSSLEHLLQLLIDNPKLNLNENYSEIINSLKKILEKDSNINVSIVAAKCITNFAKSLQNNFSIYSKEIISIIFERLKEKKPLLRDALIECIDAVYATTNLDYISDSIISAANKSNPNIKIQLNCFLYRICKNLKTDEISKKFLKELIPILIKHANESDPGVREAACSALGAIMKFFGQNAALIFFGSFANDKLKMAKVEEFYAKAVEEAKLEVVHKDSKIEEDCSEKDTIKTDQCENAIIKKEIDTWEILDPINIFPKIPSTFKENIQSTKWLERKTALESLNRILTENPRLLSSLDYCELIADLTKILNNDLNINVLSYAAKCITGIAKGLRKDFYNYSRLVLPVIFTKFKDKKTILKDALVECSDAVYASTNLEAIIEDVLEAGQKPYLDTKIQLDLFLFRVFKKLNSSEISKKSLKEIILILTKHACDSDANVRNASYLALGAIMKCIGEKVALSLFGDLTLDKTKLAKINQYYNEILIEYGLLKANNNSDVLSKNNNNFKNNHITKTLLINEKKAIIKPLKDKKINIIEKNENLYKENKQYINQTKNKTNFKITKSKKNYITSNVKIESKKKNNATVNTKNSVSKTNSVKLKILENNKFYNTNAKSDYNIENKNENKLNFNIMMQPRFKSQQDFFKPLKEKIFINGQKSRIPRLSLYQLSTYTK